MPKLTASSLDRCTFAVDDVPLATTAMDQVPYPKAVESLLGGPVEACSSYRGTLVSYYSHDVINPLIATIMLGYCRHYPVVLSPDVIWLTITQGLACHINVLAEQLRSQFVSHQGQATIRVRRDDFFKGSPENPWPEVFAEFSSQIRDQIGDENHQLIVADFSTTGPVERAASEIVLLAAMQKSFRYEFVSICGIPSITLTGTVEDWERLLMRVEAFARYDLTWWIDALLPILKQFVSARQGDVDTEFWRSIYHHQQMRRIAYVPINTNLSGWIINLFPYLVAGADYQQKTASPLQSNQFLGSEPPSRYVYLAELPARPAMAPFQWKLMDREFDMEFIGGLLGVRQDLETLAVTPEVGWAVREASAADMTSSNTLDCQVM